MTGRCAPIAGNRGMYYRCIGLIAVNMPTLSDVISGCLKRVNYVVLSKAFSYYVLYVPIVTVQQAL